MAGVNLRLFMVTSLVYRDLFSRDIMHDHSFLSMFGVILLEMAQARVSVIAGTMLSWMVLRCTEV